ncbi:hypothetical protein Vretimale_3243, partial [Volvox reticuliferus]
PIYICYELEDWLLSESFACVVASRWYAMGRSAAVGLAKAATARSVLYKSAYNNTRCRKITRVVAFKEQDNIKDWRVKQMVDTCHVYYSSFWSRGELAAADALLDPQFVYRDLCSVAGWAQRSPTGTLPPTGMVVGPRAFKALVGDVRTQYPDYYIEVGELAVSDTHRIFVTWVSHGTQLEAPTLDSASSNHTAPSAGAASAASQKHQQDHHQHHNPKPTANVAPSYHNSLVHGVDVITFNHDRSRMLEVNVFRQLSSDERRDVERRLAPNPLEIRLARLHWE